MVAFLYNTAKQVGLASGTSFAWASTTLKLTLVSNNYTANPDHSMASQFSGAELSEITSFTAGFAGTIRQTLGTKTVTLNLTDDQVEYRAADVTWTTISAGTVYGAIILTESGANSDGNAPLIAFYTVATTTTNDTNFTLSWNASGAIVLASG